MYDTPFRSYDAQLGRFHQIDPLADLAPGINPYRFGFNNPISLNDPTGLYEGSIIDLVNDLWNRTTGDFGVFKNVGGIFVQDFDAEKDINRVLDWLDEWALDGGGGGIRKTLYGRGFGLTVNYSVSYINTLKTPPRSLGDLWLTFIDYVKSNYVKNAKGGYDFIINIIIEMNSEMLLASAFNMRNPGLWLEVLAHERGHVEQFEKAFGTVNALGQFNDSGLTGNPLDALFSDLLDQVYESVRNIPNVEGKANVLSKSYLPLNFEMKYNNNKRKIIW
jgi:hypothetical protein